MPKRRYPTRKRTYKRRTRKMYKRAKRATVGTVSRMISRSEETKFGYYAANNQTSSAGAYFEVFGNLSQGTSNTTRLGQKVTAVEIQLRVGMQCNPLTSSRLRLVMFRDRQTNGGNPPSFVDLFLDKVSGQQWFSGFDPATVGKRYQILMDRTYNLQVGGGAADFPDRKMCIFKKRGRWPVIYNGGNAGTVADINKGHIMCGVFADVVANFPLYWYEVLVKYKDA